jgi:hypothetical protein
MANNSMANEVYLLTHDGLSQMVSSRVATRFLEKAMEAKGYLADTVSSEEMREILQGSILRELRQILPKDGVERSIKQIARSLRKQAEKVSEAALAVANAPASSTSKSSENLPSVSSVSGNVLLTEDDETPHPDQALTYSDASVDLGIVSHSSPLEDAHAFDTGEVEAAIASALSFDDSEEIQNSVVQDDGPVTSQVKPSSAAQSENVVQKIVPSSIPTSPVPTSPVFAQELDPETLAKMLVKFAQLENVKVVAAMRPNGEISMARGSGFDLDALSRIGSLGLKLLSRGRSIRSYYLSNSRYQLFMFPLASHTLIVVGSSEVNVGEVFSILSHLKSQSHLEEEV